MGLKGRETNWQKNIQDLAERISRETGLPLAFVLGALALSQADSPAIGPADVAALIALYAGYLFAKQKDPLWKAPGMPGWEGWDQPPPGSPAPQKPPEFKNWKDKAIYIIAQTLRVFKNIFGGGP